MSDKIRPQHVARQAILYVRQSSAYGATPCPASKVDVPRVPLQGPSRHPFIVISSAADFAYTHHRRVAARLDWPVIPSLYQRTC
jgi:hypothetical protein